VDLILDLKEDELAFYDAWAIDSPDPIPNELDNAFFELIGSIATSDNRKEFLGNFKHDPITLSVEQSRVFVGLGALGDGQTHHQTTPIGSAMPVVNLP
jgi:hypothetical protein